MAGPVVTMIGGTGTFGTLSSVTVTPSGHSFSVLPVTGWQVGAGLCLFYSRATPDGQLILSTIGFTNNELKPTEDHAELCAYDPATEGFYSQVIPTSTGQLTAVNPATGLGGTDTGAGDIALVETATGPAILTTQEGYYFSWDLPSDGLYPALAYFSESGGQWLYEPSASLTSNQWEATNPGLFGTVIAGGLGKTAGSGGSYWSPRFPGQMAVLPASGNAVIGHYFGFGGTAVASGGLSVITPSGSLVAAYQIPNITPLSGTLTLAAVRDVEADPTSLLNKEQFSVIYDAFGTGIHPTIQVFSYNQSAETIAPVSVPCVPADTGINPQYCLYGPDGSLYVSCGQVSNGLLGANMQVYLPHGGGSSNLVTQAPVFGGWQSSSWPTAVAADYSLGFTQGLGIQGLAGPLAIDDGVTGALLVPGISGRLGVSVPAATGGLGPNLLTTFQSVFAPASLLSANDATYASTIGSWVTFVGTVARVASPPVAPPAGTAAARITQPFSSGNNAASTGTTTYSVNPNISYQFDTWFLANTTGRTCEAWIRWTTSGGTTISDATHATTSDNSSTYSKVTPSGTAPSNAEHAQLWIQVDTPANGEAHFWAANALYETDAAQTGWSGFLTNLILAEVTSGTWALRASATGSNETLFAQSPSIAVTPFQEYFAGAFFEAVSGTPGQLCSVNVNWRNAGGGTISTTPCTMTVTDTTSGFLQATCGAMAPATAATAVVTLTPVTTTTGQAHYARLVTFQTQPYSSIPFVDYEVSALRGVVSPSIVGLLGRPSIVGRSLYIPLPVQFSPAELASYNAGNPYTPGFKPQFLAAIDLSQLLPPVVTGIWTASQAIGNGTGIPAPPTMPLPCPVENSGDEGAGMVALLGWTLPPGYLGADMAVTDDAHNAWWPLGAPACSSSATGLTRTAIWASPGAFAARNVYMSPVGLPQPCYPAVMGITVIEIADMSPYLGIPVTATAVQNGAGTISAVLASPGATAIQLAVAATDGTVSLSGPGTGWGALTGVNASGGGFRLRTSPAWQVQAGAGTATWTSSVHADLSAAVAEILVVNPAPFQPLPAWPAVSFQAGFGSGALTPPGQVAWTDITQRWLAGEETSSQAGKPYELDQLQAAEQSVTLDDNDGSLTADNPSSAFFPNVTADTPLRLIAWWDGRTYGVMAGFAERWPVNWDDTWFGMVKVEFPDAWALQQNQLNAVLLEETTWDPNLYALWTCSDPQFITGATPTLSAQNVAPGNTNALQVVESKNGAVGSNPAQQFGAQGGGLPGDQSATFWEQSGLTSGSEGYGWCLFCADQGYPLLSTGVTFAGWFNPTGATTQVENTAGPGGVGTLILMRGSNAGSGPAFQVFLESPVGANPGAICVAVWDVSTGTGTVTTVFPGNWLTAGWFHIAIEVTQVSWTLFINGTSEGTGSANLPEVISWLEYLGSADRFYTGSMLNGACGYLAVFGVLLPADRVQSIYLAGTPNPATTAGGAMAARNGAQFGTEFPAQRIERLLAYGGWTGPRSISQSSTTQMAPINDIQGSTAVIAASGAVNVTSGGQQAGQAAGNIVFSDGGQMFTDGNFTLCYLSRGDLYGAQSAWILGEDVQAGEIPYLPDATLGYDKSLLYNGAQLTPSVSVTGAPVTAALPASIAAHGEYIFNGTAYQNQVAQVADEASWIVNTRGVITLRAEEVTADAMANPEVWPFVLGVQAVQPVTVHRRPQLADYEVTMFPVTAQVTKALDFQTGVATAKVTTDMFPEGTVLTAGDPVLGQANGKNSLPW